MGTTFVGIGSHDSESDKRYFKQIIMQQPSFARKVLPLFFVFVVVNSFVLYFQQELNDKKIDALVVFTANCLLFVLSALSLAMHIQSMNKKSPNTSVRGIMAVTLIKLMVLGGAAMMYLVIAGSNRSLYAVFVGMFLYLVYTFLEVWIASKNNQDNNGSK